MNWQFVLTGLLIGALVGMTGMGGGSLMTPILVIVFGFKPTLAVGTDILHGAIFKTVGAFRHRQLGTVHAQLSGWMFLGSAPASLLGVALGTHLKDHQQTMNYLLGAGLLFGAAGLIAKSFIKTRVIGADERFDMKTRDRIAAVSIGLVGGFIVGLTSVGSGTFFALTMIFVFPLGAHKVVGTDILHAAALLYVAGFGHIIAGNVDLHVVGWLLIGSIPGVLIGSHFSVRLPESALRFTLANVLALSGLKLINVPNMWLAVALGISIASVVFVVVREHRRWLARRRSAADPLAHPEPLTTR
jgi:uncharacterized membrane protein YfcA